MNSRISKPLEQLLDIALIFLLRYFRAEIISNLIQPGKTLVNLLYSVNQEPKLGLELLYSFLKLVTKTNLVFLQQAK